MNSDRIIAIIAAGAAVAGIVVWSYSTFATKEEVKAMWARLEEMSQTLNRTAEGVAYIKGRIEPKANNQGER